MKRDRLSLATVVIGIIVIVVSVVLITAGMIAYRSYSTQKWAEFHSTVDLETERLLIALAPAIWNLEIDQIQKLMESLMHEPRYAGIAVDIGTAKFIEVRDERGAIVNSTLPPLVDQSLQRQRPVIYASEAIGELTLYATSIHLEAELRQARFFFIALAVLLDLLLTLALYLSMQHLVLKPLRDVERYANDIANGNTSSAGYRQLDLFGELNRLARSIDTLLRQLTQRNLDLANSSDRLQTIIRLLPIPIVLYDNRGNNIYANERFVATFGYTLEDIPDSASWFESAYPDAAYREEAMATWQREVASALAEQRPIRALPYRIRCRDGATKHVEIGGIVANEINIVVLSDVTARTQAEEELRRYREHLEDLVTSRTAELVTTNRRLSETQFAMEHAGIGIAWIDPENGRFLYVNDQACELFGRSHADLLQARVSDVTDDFSHEHSQAFARDLVVHGYTRLEIWVGHADGERLPIEVSLYFQPPSPEAPAGRYCAFITDISQRKAAEASLIDAKQAAELLAKTRSEFLANMSHEIRTPMNAIIGMSELALEGPLEAKQHNFIKKVHQSAVTLLGILNDILDFSKVEAGHLKIERIPFNLDAILDNLGNFGAHLAEKKALTYLFDLPGNLPDRLIGDPTRINQILMNLVSNAIKFTDTGTVVVSCRASEATSDGNICLNFAVRDTGIGMTSSQVKGLFTPFQQGDSTISRRYGGTGLGLAISKQLTELMDGQISVSSRPGTGSTFTVSLPCQLPKDYSPSKATFPEFLCDQDAIVVHPDAETRTILCRMLSDLGMRSQGVETGLQALAQLARGTSIRLMLSGISLPDRQATELVHDISIVLGNQMPRIVLLATPSEFNALYGATDKALPCTIAPSPLRPSVLLAALNGDYHVSEIPAVSLETLSDRLDGMDILLVEDNELNQELALEVLEARGANVTLAGNGQIALDLLAARHFDCVLMDVQMPVMDGLAATRAIRADQRWQSLPIVAMTAGAMPEEHDKTRQAGMDAHITKPIEIDTLVETIRRLTNTASAKEEFSTPLVLPSQLPSPKKQPLDTNRGLRTINGNNRTYARLLDLLTTHTGEKIERLHRACAAGDHQSAATIAHDIRGGCTSVGANLLADYMHHLELACHDGNDSEALLQLVEKARTAWQITEAACLRFRKKSEAATGNIDGLKNTLAQLRQHLMADDLEAVACARRLFDEPIPQDQRSALVALEKKVMGYRFDDALNDLDNLIEILSGETTPESAS